MCCRSSYIVPKKQRHRVYIQSSRASRAQTLRTRVHSHAVPVLSFISQVNKHAHKQKTRTFECVVCILQSEKRDGHRETEANTSIAGEFRKRLCILVISLAGSLHVRIRHSNFFRPSFRSGDASGFRGSAHCWASRGRRRCGNGVPRRIFERRASRCFAYLREGRTDGACALRLFDEFVEELKLKGAEVW